MAGAILLIPFVASILIYLGTHFQKQYFNTELITDFSMLCIGALFVSYGIWKVRSWGFYLLLVFAALVIGMDLQQIISNPKTLNFWHFVDATMVLVGLGLIFQEKVRAPYFNPKIRWWERASRHQTDIQGHFKLDSQKTSALILDVSATGCFASFDMEMNLGSIIEVAIDFGTLHFESKAKYVRKSANPVGVGLMFVDTDSANKKVIKSILREIVKQSPTTLSGNKATTLDH